MDGNMFQLIVNVKVSGAVLYRCVFFFTFEYLINVGF